MNIESLLFDSRLIVTKTAANEILANQEYFKELIELSLKEKPTISARASRVTDFCTREQPEIILPFLSTIIESLRTMKDQSNLKNFVSILIRYLDKIDEDSLGKLVDLCFKWINSASSTIALKIYSIDIIYIVVITYPELKNEFILSLENLVIHGSAGEKNKAGRLLKKL
jgi:hypothetical protein